MSHFKAVPVFKGLELDGSTQPSIMLLQQSKTTGAPEGPILASGGHHSSRRVFSNCYKLNYLKCGPGHPFT